MVLWPIKWFVDSLKILSLSLEGRLVAPKLVRRVFFGLATGVLGAVVIFFVAESWNPVARLAIITAAWLIGLPTARRDKTSETDISDYILTLVVALLFAMFWGNVGTFVFLR